MSEITKNQLKHVRLLKQKKYRSQYGEFIVEGEKNVTELLHSNMEISAIFATQDWDSAKIDFPVTLITNKELSQLSSLSSPNHVLAIAKIPPLTFSSSLISSGKTVVLHDINDPGNLGTIIRTADWFGIKNIICTPNSVDCYNPKVVQSTKGSIANVAIFYEELAAILEEYPHPIFAADMEGEKLSPSFQSPKDCLLIMGSESHGIPKELSSFITKKLTIPRIGKAESLNVAIATSIFLHQFNS